MARTDMLCTIRDEKAYIFLIPYFHTYWNEMVTWWYIVQSSHMFLHEKVQSFEGGWG